MSEETCEAASAAAAGESASAAAAGESASAAAAGESAGALSAAARARAERNRLRARSLRDARLLLAQAPAAHTAPLQKAAWDSGGGFLLEPQQAAAAPRLAPRPPAPLQPAERAPCLHCGVPFAASYLLDTFDHCVCDACRDEEGAHALLTRTEALGEFLLKECDLDARPPPLRCVRRPNPHRGARNDMRLYLRAQVEARALQVWGSQAALQAEREARAERRARTAQRGAARRLRELRMAARSSLYTKPERTHEHRWGAETRDEAGDCYSRACLDCGHVQTYEKM